MRSFGFTVDSLERQVSAQQQRARDTEQSRMAGQQRRVFYKAFNRGSCAEHEASSA
jgi:hypothetical protein